MNDQELLPMKPLVLLGAGEHAKVLQALIKASGHSIVGVCDPALKATGVQFWRGLPVLGDDSLLDVLDSKNIELVNCIGKLTLCPIRERIFNKACSKGFKFPALVHPYSWVAPGVILNPGVQIMAGAIVQPDVVIGENAIINSRTSIDHDCVIGKNVHIAPGATLCGGVLVGDGSFVGAGVTIIQHVAIGSQSVIGAGITVLKSVGDHQVVRNNFLNIRG